MKNIGLITKPKVKAWLSKKPSAYQSGWYACQSGISHRSIEGPKEICEQYDQGYSECFANQAMIDNEVAV